MALITAREIGKSHGGQIILGDVSFDVNASDHVGVVGPNGSGKTTLFRLILGLETPDSGDIAKGRSIRLGHLAQHNIFEEERSVIEEAMTAFTSLFEMERQMRELELKMAEVGESKELDRLLHRHATLNEEFERAEGYAAHARAEATLQGLGVDRSLFDRPVQHLSGGEAGRVALAKLLLTSPDVLLLDEPTNHLDIAGCEWLEDYLSRFGSAFMVISHDRYFLENVTNRTLEVDGGTARMYPKKFSLYEELKAEMLLSQRREFEEQKKHIRKEKEFIRKHMGTQRTREAKGRRKRLERMDVLETPRQGEDEMLLRFSPRRRLGAEVIQAEGVSIAFDERSILDNLDLEVSSEDRLGIVGPNGTGKSTLLKIIVGEIQPQEGGIKLGKTVEIGYFDQVRADVPHDSTPHEEIASADLSLTDHAIRSYLARFLFHGDEVARRCGALSGGERSRLAFAKLLLQRPNVLVLDEPTNHLDIPSRRAVEDALADFDAGALIVVSHDRFFLDRLCDKILWLDEESATLYTGNYTAARDRRRKAEADATREREEAKARKGRQRKPGGAGGRGKKAKLRPVEKVEADIMTREQERSAVLKAMESEDVYRDPDQLRDHKERLETIKADLLRLEKEYELYD